MGTVVSLKTRREQREIEEHARALVIFELSTILARRGDPALLRLLEDRFGAEEIARRVRMTSEPRRNDEAERHIGTIRRHLP